MTKVSKKRFAPKADSFHTPLAKTKKTAELTTSEKRKRVSWAENLERIQGEELSLKLNTYGSPIVTEAPRAMSTPLKGLLKVRTPLKKKVVAAASKIPMKVTKKVVKVVEEQEPDVDDDKNDWEVSDELLAQKVAEEKEQEAKQETPQKKLKKTPKKPVVEDVVPLKSKQPVQLPADEVEDAVLSEQENDDDEEDEDVDEQIEDDLPTESGDVPAKPKKLKTKKSNTHHPENKLTCNKDYVKFDYKIAMDRTVFVGNVPYKMKAQHLRKLFLPYGKIEAIYKRSLLQKTEKLTKKMFGTDKELRTTVTEAHIYVRFEKAEDAQRSTELNGTTFGNNVLRVTLSNDKSTDPSRSIFVGNLPYQVTEQALLEFVNEKVGNIDSVRIIHDKATGLGKGYGFVTFKKEEHVSKALTKLAGERFKGRSLRLTKLFKKKKNRPMPPTSNDHKRRHQQTQQLKEERGLKHKLANYTVTKNTFSNLDKPSKNDKLSKKVIKSIKKRKQTQMKSRTLLK